MPIHLVKNALADSHALLAGLPVDEQARLSAIRHPRVQRQALASAWLRRELLAKHCQQPASQLQFGYSSHGKPRLLNQPLAFNISHTGDWVALIIDERDCGVDLEDASRPRRWPALARHVLSPAEWKSWQSDGAQASDLVARWTLKEAWLKGLGLGLGGGLRQTEFDLESDQPLGRRPDLEQDQNHAWHFGQCWITDCLSLAWAWQRSDRPQMRRWRLRAETQAATGSWLQAAE